MSFGTQSVGFLKLPIFGLRAIEHPARAVALTTEIIALQASCPSHRTAAIECSWLSRNDALDRLLQ
jgi:hypothetical protein